MSLLIGAVVFFLGLFFVFLVLSDWDVLSALGLLLKVVLSFLIIVIPLGLVYLILVFVQSLQ